MRLEESTIGVKSEMHYWKLADVPTASEPSKLLAPTLRT